MSNLLEGKIALVAGATRCAGRGIAIELGAAGATVYCTGRLTVAKRLISRIDGEQGRLDILVSTGHSLTPGDTSSNSRTPGNRRT